MAVADGEASAKRATKVAARRAACSEPENACPRRGLHRGVLLVLTVGTACGSRSALPADLAQTDAASPAVGGAAGSPTNPPSGGAAGAGLGGSAGAAIGCDDPDPVLLATDDNVGGVAIDESAVYWSHAGYDGAVYRIDKCGGPVKQLAGGETIPLGVALDESYVYWAMQGNLPFNGAVKRAPKSGGAVAVLVEPVASPWSITVDQDAVFYGNFQHLARVTKTGGPGQPLSQQGGFANLASDDDYVYFAGQTGVGRIPKLGGGGGTSYDSKPPFAWCIAVDADSVYWTSYPGPLMTAAKIGGQPKPLAPKAYRRCLAVDEEYVYWGQDTPSPTGLFRISKAGGAQPEQIWAGAGAVYVAVDSDFVYWSADGIWRMRK